MNKAELVTALLERGVDPNAFDVDERRNATEIYVLQRRERGLISEPDFWVTFYGERGIERGLRHFPSEAEACQYFLEWVAGDPTTQRISG